MNFRHPRIDGENLTLCEFVLKKKQKQKQINQVQTVKGLRFQLKGKCFDLLLNSLSEFF